MLKLLLFTYIWLTLVSSKALLNTSGLPELKLPEVILVAIALSLRLVNKASKKQLSWFTALEMILYAMGMFYIFLIFIEYIGLKVSALWKLIIELAIALFSMEIVNEGLKTGGISVVKFIQNYLNKNVPPNDSNT